MICKITKKAYLKMKYYIEGCEDEISGFGKVTKTLNEDNEEEFKITDIEIMKQTVSGVSAIIDEETIAKFLYEKTKRNQSTAPYRVWWHSHATMNSFFSTTDDSTIDKSTEFPYLISIVSNHKHEIKARIDIFQPIRLTQEINIIIEEDDDETLREKCEKEIKRKVKTNSSSIATPHYNNYQGHYPKHYPDKNDLDYPYYNDEYSPMKGFEPKKIEKEEKEITDEEEYYNDFFHGDVGQRKKKSFF